MPPDFGWSAACAAVGAAGKDSANKSAVAANARTLSILSSPWCFGLLSRRLRADDSHRGLARQPAKSFRRIGNLDDTETRGATTQCLFSMRSSFAILRLTEIAFCHRIVVLREVPFAGFCIAPQ